MLAAFLLHSQRADWVIDSNPRVALTWAPVRPQRGPYTGRGARTDGLVSDRTR